MFGFVLAQVVVTQAAAAGHPRPEYFLGWGTLSLINAGLAQGKNRSGLAWWLVSLVLGPIATFLIVVIEKAPAPTAGAPAIAATKGGPIDDLA